MKKRSIINPNQSVSFIGDSTPRIDISQIPDYAMNRLCATLCKCVGAALSDPKLRQEYEDWKKERGGMKQEIN